MTKLVKIQGTFNVTGIVNTNGGDSGLRSRYLTNHKNHNYAKVFEVGRTEEGKPLFRSYTSSNCIRNAMFKDIHSFADDSNFAQLASTSYLLRGSLITVKDLGSYKRKSCVSVLDAMDTEDVTIVKEQRTKSGERDSTSIHSMDNLPARKQTLDICIDIQELQFVCLDSKINESVPKEKREEFVTGLKKYFEFNSVNSDIEVKKYKSKADEMQQAIDGILFNDEQITFLVNKTVELIENIRITKRGARFEVGEFTVNDENGNIVDSNNAEYHKFYEEV